MIKDNESFGDLVRCLLIHMKCIQIRMQYSTHNYKGDSKYKINTLINKVESAIDGVCNLTKNREVVQMIKDDLEKADLVYHMVIAEQLYNINEETLREITDLIDDYLLQKVKEKNEQKMGN